MKSYILYTTLVLLATTSMQAMNEESKETSRQVQNAVTKITQGTLARYIAKINGQTECWSHDSSMQAMNEESEETSRQVQNAVTKITQGTLARYIAKINGQTECWSHDSRKRKGYRGEIISDPVKRVKEADIVSPASVCKENYQELEQLFEGFMKTQETKEEERGEINKSVIKQVIQGKNYYRAYGSIILFSHDAKNNKYVCDLLSDKDKTPALTQEECKTRYKNLKAIFDDKKKEGGTCPGFGTGFTMYKEQCATEKLIGEGKATEQAYKDAATFYNK